MAKKYTKEELENMGMSEGQIVAIMNTYAQEEEAPVAPVKVAYNEADITTITDIVKYTSGSIVRLPDFADGQQFIAKLKRPSMLALMKSGKIPNSLLNQATQLFSKGAGSLGKENSIEDLYDIMEIILEEALISPSYKEIKEAGVELSDDQIMAVFGYTQQGVKALENFR